MIPLPQTAVGLWRIGHKMWQSPVDFKVLPGYQLGVWIIVWSLLDFGLFVDKTGVRRT